LLSDEFVAFSEGGSSRARRKKVLEEEFKTRFEEYKAKKKDLESRVAAASAKWDEWRTSQKGK
jgi:hypothetical protein